MKKFLLLFAIILFVMPVWSLKAASAHKLTVSTRQEKTAEFYVGYFEKDGYTYDVWGDEYGNVTKMEENGVEVACNGSWGNTYGLNHGALGCTVNYTGSLGNKSYSGVVFQ